MSQDIIIRLRSRFMDTKHMIRCALEHEAANEIESLRQQLASRDAEVAELRYQVTELQGQVGLLLRTAKALAAMEHKP